MSASGIRFVGMLGEWIIDLYLELRIVKRRFFSAAVKYTVVPLQLSDGDDCRLLKGKKLRILV